MHIAFYARGASGSLGEIPDYHLATGSGPIFDEIRLLHFSFAPDPDSLPPDSEIVSILDANKPYTGPISNLEVARKLVTDPDRNAGRLTSSFYMGQAHFNGKGIMAKLGELVLPGETLHYLREEVLQKSPRGRRYLYDYSANIRFVQLERAMLSRYAALIPQIKRAADIFKEQKDSEPIITPETVDLISDLIDDHRDKGDAGFAELLDRLEVDLAGLSGKKREDFLTYLMN